MRGRFNGRVVGQDYTGRNTRHNGRAGVYNAVQSAFAPSLDITLANGLGPLFTFTRATTATVTDFEGLIKSCLSGELRIQGARRVENKSTRTESLDNAAWSRLNANITTGVSAPDGTNTAYTLTATGANGEIFQALTTIAGTLHRGSWWIRRRTGSGTVSMYQNNGATAIADPSATWQRMTPAAAGAATTTTVYSGIKLATSGDAVDLWHPQLQDVTGQALQVPDEYVPNDTGIYSSPYSGYFASGVKYFSYQNGNTVSSNVVTEASGAAITGTIGYLAEGARTNRCLHSQAFSNAVWVSGGGGIAVTDNSIAAPDGTTTADTLTASGANGTLIQDLGVVASAAKAGGLWLKRKTGTGNIDITLDGGATWTTKAVTSTWTRFEITQTLADEDFGIRIVTSGDEVYAWQGQVETAAFLSSDIPTTTAAVARNADVLTCPLAGILDNAQGSCYVEAQFSWPAGNTAQGSLVCSAGGGAPLYLRATTQALSLFDGTADRAGNVVSPSASIQKLASNWGGSSAKTFIAGVASSSLTFDGDLGATGTLQIGCDNSVAQLNGVISKVRIYRQKLSDAQLQAMTS